MQFHCLQGVVRGAAVVIAKAPLSNGDGYAQEGLKKCQYLYFTFNLADF